MIKELLRAMSIVFLLVTFSVGGESDVETRRLILLYKLDGLPVCVQANDGKPCFAPELLLTYLKTRIGSEVWQ